MDYAREVVNRFTNVERPARGALDRIAAATGDPRGAGGGTSGACGVDGMMRGHPAMPRPRFISVNWFADSLAAGALLAILALLVLWSRSHHLGGDERVFEAPGGRLHFCSRDGRVMLSAFEPEGQRSWRATPRSPMAVLMSDDDKFLVLDLRGWAAGVPHGVLAAVIGVVPAWWWFVHRAATERDRRRAHGLCRECGYDLRAASERCPECGTPVAPGIGRMEKLPSVSRDDRETVGATSRLAAEAGPPTGTT